MIDSYKMGKFINTKINQLHEIIADIESLTSGLKEDFYRISIFGSARIKPESQTYKRVYSMSRQLSHLGADIITGGGPGIMEAANSGAKAGHPSSRSYGLHIELHFETDANSHLDVMHRHRRFSSRLDEFMRLSNAIIVAEGGVGTLLELFYSLQLMQVGHIEPMPIILLGDFWGGLIDWLKKEPLGRSLLNQQDVDSLQLVHTAEEAVQVLKPHIEAFNLKRVKPETIVEEALPSLELATVS